MMKGRAGFLVLVFGGALLFASGPPSQLSARQDKKDASTLDPVLQSKVDDAIRRGVEYLKTAESFVAWEAMGNSDELILWTLVHADVPFTDPVFRALLQKVLATPLQRTYKVALQAMILEEVDRVNHQGRLWQCAQFLVDNQCANGQWSYGEPTTAANEVPSIPKTVATSNIGKTRDFGDSAGGKRVKPKVVRKIPVTRTKTGPGGGDNSNSQYALLGLRACADAGIQLPKEVAQLSRKWWLDCQHKVDGSGKVATGPGAGDPRGWCYKEKDSHPAYGSMTAGAVGSVAICDYLLEMDWKKDPSVVSGLSWLTTHYTVTENTGPPEERPAGTAEFFYYYLYALERAGLLCGTETLGTHRWYPEGAQVLVDLQKPDGSWEHAGDWNKPVWNTCFAILFLKRATRPLVVSVDRK